MNTKLIFKKEYEITFRFFKFFNYNFNITPVFLSELDFSRDKKYVQDLKKKFGIYHINVDDVISAQHVILRSEPFVEVFNICIYDTYAQNELLRILEIEDVMVNDRYRNRGIGGQLMKILDTVASENSIKFLVGELQSDDVHEPLIKRKAFFEKNGFTSWHDDNAGFSGWVIKKSFSKNYEKSH